MNATRMRGQRTRSVARRALAALLFLTAGAVFAHGPLVEQVAKVNAEIERDPTNAELYLRRGELHRVHEEWDAALADYARARRLAPTEVSIDFLRGRALQEAGRPEPAKVALDTYLEHHPSHVEARLERARALGALGEHRAAADDYTFALERIPRPDPDLYLARARAQLAAAETAQAAAGIDEAMARLGPLPVLQLFAIELDVTLGRFDAALARLEAVAARSPRKEAWHARRGEILARAGRQEEARAAYAEALAAIVALPPVSRRAKAIADLEGNVKSALASN